MSQEDRDRLAKVAGILGGVVVQPPGEEYDVEITLLDPPEWELISAMIEKGTGGRPVIASYGVPVTAMDKKTGATTPTLLVGINQESLVGEPREVQEAQLDAQLARQAVENGFIFPPLSLSTTAILMHKALTTRLDLTERGAQAIGRSEPVHVIGLLSEARVLVGQVGEEDALIVHHNIFSPLVNRDNPLEQAERKIHLAAIKTEVNRKG